MGHLSYEDSKKLVYKGLVLLAVVTLIEVFFSLLGKGHVIAGLEDISWLGYVIGFILIALSLYKAYYIIYEFMHMRYEVKGLALSVLLPTVLLIWAIIAFFQEGSSWKNRRDQIKEKDKEQVEEDKAKEELQGLLDEHTVEFEFRG
jgi:cytochrome c oxidase subunit IV